MCFVSKLPQNVAANMYFLGAGHLGVAQPVFLFRSCPGVQSSLGSVGLASVSSLTPALFEGLLSYMWKLQSLSLLSVTRAPLCCQKLLSHRPTPVPGWRAIHTGRCSHTNKNTTLLSKLLSPRPTPAPGGRAQTHREMYSYKDVTYQEIGTRGGRFGD